MFCTFTKELLDIYVRHAWNCNVVWNWSLPPSLIWCRMPLDCSHHRHIRGDRMSVKVGPMWSLQHRAAGGSPWCRRVTTGDITTGTGHFSILFNQIQCCTECVFTNILGTLVLLACVRPSRRLSLDWLLHAARPSSCARPAVECRASTAHLECVCVNWFVGSWPILPGYTAMPLCARSNH